MSDLEDDVLMQLIETAKQLDQVKTETASRVKHFQDRANLLEVVWKKLDKLLRVILAHPELAEPLQVEIEGLRESVVTVLTFDNKEKK